MRKFHQIIPILLIGGALGWAPTAAGEVKIAVVDVQRAILNSAEAQSLLEKLQNEFADQQEEISELQSEAAAMLERLQKDGEVMSDAEKRKLSQQIESKNNDFVYLRQKLQRQYEERQKELFAGMDQKFQRSVEELVLSEDYDLILPRQAVLYAGDLYDITRKVTEKLNALDNP